MTNTKPQPMNYFRAAIRGILLIILLIVHIAPLAIRPLFVGFQLPYALRIRRLWVKRTLKMLGVRVEVKGRPPLTGKYVFVGNHRSYLDPAIVLKDVEAVPVGKAEVAAWPLIGYGAKVSGVMFVKRESKASRAATLGAMGEVLKTDHPVLVYPEGTTHVLPKTMELRLGAFKLAVREGAPVVPMAIDYADLGDAWVGDDTFVPHFLRCFGKKRTLVKIRYGSPVTSDDPASLASSIQVWLDENMAEIRAEFDQQQ